MIRDDSDVAGKRLERRVLIERILNPESGEEFPLEKISEVRENWDGTIETVESPQPQVLACGHLHHPGDPVAVCQVCSKKAGRTILVCAECQVGCPICGKATCVKHSEPGRGGYRYCCSRCERKGAKLLGLTPSSGLITGAIRTILRWW